MTSQLTGQRDYEEVFKRDRSIRVDTGGDRYCNVLDCRYTIRGVAMCIWTAVLVDYLFIQGISLE